MPNLSVLLIAPFLHLEKKSFPINCPIIFINYILLIATERFNHRLALESVMY